MLVKGLDCTFFDTMHPWIWPLLSTGTASIRVQSVSGLDKYCEKMKAQSSDAVSEQIRKDSGRILHVVGRHERGISMLSPQTHLQCW